MPIILNRAGRWSLLGVLLLAAAAFPAGSAQAHELKKDGAISVVLHTEPDDNPASGRPVRIALFFTDSTNRFVLADCDCFLSFQEGGRPPTAERLTQGDGLYAEQAVVFPRSGIYGVQVSGRPKKTDGFQPFTVSYEVRVGEGRPASMPLWAGLALGGLIGGVLAAAVWTERRARAAD